MQRVLLLAALALAAAACVGDSKAENIERCVPGLVVFCACDDGAIGTQMCDDDGRYGACVCGPAGDTDGSGDTGDTGSDAFDADGSGDVGDTGTDGGSDGGDAPSDTTPPAELGRPCQDHSDCASAFCGDFSTGRACTRDCLGTCDDAPADWICFNRVCTPLDHCDLDASETGVGPGCADARCGGCPSDSDCVGFEFGRYDCVCHDGFVRSDDFATCDDIDECAGDEPVCPEITTCFNEPGGFRCDCNEGYWGPGCEVCPGGAETPCSGNGTCDDGTEGTGVCACDAGWAGPACDEECYAVSPAACAGADLTAVLFSGRNVSGGDFTDANLTGVTAIGANFQDTTLDRTNFTSAGAANARFDRAAGDGTLFVGAQLPGANFSDVTLTGARFADATMTNLSFLRAVVTDSDFTRVLLGTATLEEGDFSRSGFRNADLSNVIAPAANFRAADLLGADFPDANLAGAIFAQADCERVDFQGANLSGANLTDADLTNANLEGAILTGAALSGVTWSNTTCVDGTNSDDNGGTCIGHL